MNYAAPLALGRNRPRKSSRGKESPQVHLYSWRDQVSASFAIADLLRRTGPEITLHHRHGTRAQHWSDADSNGHNVHRGGLHELRHPHAFPPSAAIPLPQGAPRV